MPVVTSQLWQELDKFLGTSSPVTYKVDPPQSLAAVLHGGVMMHLLFNMPSDNARSIRGFEEAAVTSWPRYLENYYSGPLLDSHCHLATTMKRYDVKDLHRLKWGSIDFQGEGTKVPVIISNAVHPECWRRYRELESLPGVFFTFGIHPLVASGQGQVLTEDQLRELLRHGQTCGIGECGFDLSRVGTDNRSEAQILEIQTRAFRMQLRLAAELNLPVVIHVRGRTPAEQTKLQIRARGFMTTHLIRNHRIHVHCFGGPAAEYQAWQQKFPKAMFGMTSKVEDGPTREVAHVIQPHQLLLESDAPFLTPTSLKQGSRRIPNSPYFLMENLRSLCQALNLPPIILGRITTHNCLTMYGIHGDGDGGYRVQK